MTIRPPPALQLLPGVQLYKYTLRHRIGSGFFGDVWLAKDQAVDREYAIKILHPHQSIYQRFREARIGHALRHDNVVRVHQADMASLGKEKFVIIAMEYMPDGPITKLANPSDFLPLTDVIRLGKDILRGL